MNIDECANCLVHGWKQLEDESQLLQWSRCKVIQYCSKECQYEHWRKVHRRQCEHFADQSKNKQWQPNEQDCIICLQVVVVGQSNLSQAENPNYECVHTVFEKLSPDNHHPHPFPVMGDPGDIREKVVIVLWQLIRKFRLTLPNDSNIGQEEFMDLEVSLVTLRLTIWRNRKIFPQPEAVMVGSQLYSMLRRIEMEMERGTMTDPFQLWKIIMLVARIERDVDYIKLSEFLKDPLLGLSDVNKKLVSKGMSNNTSYMTIANEVLVALTTKVIPYEDILKIICSGSLEQKCNLCSKDVFIRTEYFSNGESFTSNLFFTPLLLGKYRCGGESCTDQGVIMINSELHLENALLKLSLQRKVNTCDFCFQRTPVKQVGSDMRDIHRCNYCRKTMYCSMECLEKDWKIHLTVCHKSTRGRKKKLGASGRREVARREVEKMNKV